jgi:hypothetical protein
MLWVSSVSVTSLSRNPLAPAFSAWEEVLVGVKAGQDYDPGAEQSMEKREDRLVPDHHFRHDDIGVVPLGQRDGLVARLHDLPTEQFADQLRALGEMPAAAFAHPAILDWLLPVVRADMTVNETYCWAAERPLSMPIFAVHLFPGGHFFAAHRHRPLLDKIKEGLAPWAP